MFVLAANMYVLRTYFSYLGFDFITVYIVLGSAFSMKQLVFARKSSCSILLSRSFAIKLKEVIMR